MDNVKCLNPWDPQSKRQYQIDGVYCALNAGHGQGGQAHGICYAIEGNVVDRVSAKNGKGWCEDVSPTLNTQDRHAVVFALEGNGARPSHMGKGFSEDGTMYTLNTIEQHSVCYGISRSALKGGRGSNGGMPIEENLSPTIVSQGTGAVAYAAEKVMCFKDREGSGAGGKGLIISDDKTFYVPTWAQQMVCYAIENHPCDSRVTMDDDGIVQTLNARMGTGGGNTPIVLMVHSQNADDNHAEREQ